MLILNLARGKSGMRVPLRLPATPADIGTAYAQLDQISAKERETRIASVVSEVEFLDRFFRDKHPEAMDEFNELAKKLDQMDEQQLQTLDGALNSESVESLADILRIADSLKDYIFVNGVTTEKELGRFLVDSGYRGFSESVKPYLDYAAIGTEYYAERGGAFTAYGYTLQRKNAESIAEQQKPVFRLKLQSTAMHRLGNELITLELPADENRLRYVKESLNVEDFAEATVMEAKCVNYLYQRFIPLASQDVYVLEELAEYLSDIESKGQTFKMLSVLALEKPVTAEEALRFAASLDSYEELRCSGEDYGKNALLQLCEDQEIIDTVDGFIDWQDFGEYMMEQDGFVYAEYGYIRKKDSPQPEQSMEMQMRCY